MKTILFEYDEKDKFTLGIIILNYATLSKNYRLQKRKEEWS